MVLFKGEMFYEPRKIEISNLSNTKYGKNNLQKFKKHASFTSGVSILVLSLFFFFQNTLLKIYQSIRKDYGCV